MCFLFGKWEKTSLPHRCPTKKSISKNIFHGFAVVERFHSWCLIPLSKWVITPVISGLTLLIPFITGVITHLLSGMRHQAASSSRAKNIVGTNPVSYRPKAQKISPFPSWDLPSGKLLPVTNWWFNGILWWLHGI